MNQLTALSIGNFDGVHRGHVELVRRARAEVGKNGRVVVICFDPHPATILQPDLAPGRLTGFHHREFWLHEAGADEVGHLQPTTELLNQSPQQFIAEIVQRYSPRVIVEGPDFRFGKGRAGNPQTLSQLGEEYHFTTCIMDSVQAALTDQSLVRVSSSMTRWLIERGRVRDAKNLLGRPYELVGTVVIGDQRGRTIGVPTANLDHGDLLLPADGIYAGTATRPDGSTYSAAISVGTKPTFGQHPRLCEAHLLGYDGPLDDYGWEIHLQFNNWLRDQIAYDNVDDLIAQLKRDINKTSQLCEVMC